MDIIRAENVENKDYQFVTVSLVDTLPQTSTNYGIFFTAKRAYEIMFVTSSFGTASTSGTVLVEKLTGTTAKGSGIATHTAISIGGATAANTPLDGVLATNSTAGVSDRQLRAGDRLALKSGGTLTNGKDLCVTVYLKVLGKGDYRL